MLVTSRCRATECQFARVVGDVIVRYPIEDRPVVTAADLEHWLAKRQKIVEQLKAYLVDGRHSSSHGVDTTESEIERLRVRLAEHQAIIAAIRARYL
jgi:hypothetical protein